MRIHQLPPAIANQIAAGEVIERPASVVKELLENSLDAGADTISVEISYGGLNHIKISDNGLGIVAEDLPLAVAAHATSKIKTLNDLYAIDTMGFRGEALASIASVAKVTISSRPADQEHAMMLRIQGTLNELSPCARSKGTTIEVVDLFFNAPVRKRFLKTEKLEFQAIELVFKRFALSAPHVALTLKHNNKSVLSLPAAVNEQAKHTRMSRIFGRSFVNDAIYLEVEQGAMGLSGWVSGPDFQRSQNDRQWIYINQRMVKDKLINHAVKQAYDGLLYPGRFPACLLYFTIHTGEVDVNVHPTKHEVRFQQPRLVHDFFTSQLTKALNSTLLKSTQELNEYSSERSFDPVVAVCESYGNSITLNTNDYLMDALISGKQNVNTMSTSNVPNPFIHRTDVKAGYKSLNDHPPKQLNKPRNFLRDSESKLSWVVLNSQHCLILIQGEPYLVDIIALQQHQLLAYLKQAGFPLQDRPLLVPLSYIIPPTVIQKFNELQKWCSQLGIHMELKNDSLLIRSVPVAVPYLDIRLLLNAIAALDTFQLEDLLELVTCSQRFDPNQLSLDERNELNQWLINLQSQKAWHTKLFKKLSSEDCRMLLDV